VKEGRKRERDEEGTEGKTNKKKKGETKTDVKNVKLGGGGKN
jgi:hypothetical protein